MATLADLMARQVTMSEQVRARADHSYRVSRITLTGLIILGLSLSTALVVAVTRAIVTPLRRVQDVLLGLAQGDLTRHADVEQGDEIGEMAQALRTATDGLRGPVEALASSAGTMAEAAADLSRVNEEIASMAERTSAQADAMAATAEQVSGNVQLVAAGAEEMGASIRQIAEDAAQAARIGTQAVHRARDANTTVTDLGDSSVRIGQVLNLITSIAEQTNLLALNATIEAARAGDAGKGFAVVAGEVKDLAGETARATGDIEDKVRAIQSGTTGAVDAISGVTSDMEQINQYQTSIATAVEEQSATSVEITRNVAEAATGSRAITDHVTGIVEAARSTSSGVLRNQQAADRLASMSSRLRETVSHFRY
jgi:methyl-accepting chemotaxis protein